MEEDERKILFLIGILVIFLGELTSGVTAQTTSRRLGFFNATLGSSATVSGTLSSEDCLQGNIVFSFRTCSYGQLVHQKGASGDSLQYALTPSGSVTLSWLWNNVTGSVSIGDSLRDNKWYTVHTKFGLGEIYINVEGSGVQLHRTMVSNSSFHLWDIDLSGGQGIQVGAGFTGCIEEGVCVTLSAADTLSQHVQWDECPLDEQAAEDCDSASSNPCWQYPCLNGGSCVAQADSYICNCPLPYNGTNCQADMGHLGCALNPCQNGGTCESVETGTRRYQCQCVAGFAGVHCEVDLDECAPRPCANDATCIDLVNGYSCVCQGTGFEGEHCTENINECVVMTPCENGGTCTDTQGTYICSCPSTYHGKNCSEMSYLCSSDPCWNGGTCTESSSQYQCHCPPGFTGIGCEVNIDECDGITCSVLNSVCHDLLLDYACVCAQGYIDPTDVTGNVTKCEEVDECLSDPCQNGATCRNRVGEYVCDCDVDFVGVNCQLSEDSCDSMPCQHGAGCTDGVGSFVCDCTPGYSGNLCEMNINECDSSQCLNGATCNDGVNSYNCTCLPGWEGTLCEEDIDECLSQPCLNGATCDNLLNAYHCNCIAGYSGIHCDFDINDCEPMPCQNSGSCVDEVNGYKCDCTDDWMGDNCAQEYDACAFLPCSNDGSCSAEPLSHDYLCQCMSGFSGDNCETNIDDCVDHTCESYQYCFDGVNDYTCDCPIGYTGAQCEEEIDECADNPCLNGATCKDHIGFFTCDCVGETVNLTSDNSLHSYWVGFKGDICEIDVDECSLSPPICLNGAVCHNVTEKKYGYSCYCNQDPGNYYSGPHCEYGNDYCGLELRCHNDGDCVENDSIKRYRCDCKPGFTGYDCETNIDECESSPCQYNSTCVDGVNSYTCECIPGITGSDCDENIDECVSEPCQNNGGCADKINGSSSCNCTDADGYDCDCEDTGFTGTHCDEDIPECLSNPCQHGATCVEGVKSYTCTCHTGYTGLHCETDVDECLSTPCQHDSTCLQRSNEAREDFTYDSAAGYDCQCTPGYTGTVCESDIDECESSPCAQGDCEDGVNSYTCSCYPGYEGSQCDQNIDECALYGACQHGSSCLDKVADYECVCQTFYKDVRYGGKNCTVQLIGCTVHQCLNRAECIPYLLNEKANQHAYTCSCPHGYAGEFCELETSASFFGNSWMKYDDTDGRASLNVQLKFRSTLSEGLLLVNLAEPMESKIDYVVLQMKGGNTMNLVYNNQRDSVSLSVRTDSKLPLNDGEWYGVDVEITYVGILLELLHTDCATRCLDNQTLDDGASTRHHDLGVTYFGSHEEDLSDVTYPLSVPFVGCMQDILVDSSEIIPDDLIESGDTHLVEAGCNRTDQCNPDPCNGNGDCTDLWWRFTCSCHRPYFGDTCEKNHEAATFGHMGEESSSRFSMPDDDQHLQELQKYNDISLFFQTWETSGLLFYLGGDATDSPGNQTFLAGQLNGGKIQLVSKLDLNIVDHLDVGEAMNDGQQHFLRVIRNLTSLRATIDDYSQEFQITASLLLNPKHLFLGGFPSGNEGSTRRRRQTVFTPLLEADNLKGVIQDARQNDHLLEFFPANDTGLDSYPEPLMDNVLAGEVTDPVCNMTQPCENNATCYDQFYNDFRCECTEGFKGKNCSDLAFCAYSQCPGDSHCNDLNNGYECVTPATYNHTSYSRYSHSINSDTVINSITASVRTREEEGLIFHVKGTGSLTNNYMTLELTGGLCSLKYDLGHSGTLQVEDVTESADGEWFGVVVTVTDSLITLSVNDSQVLDNSTQTVALRDLIESSDNIFVGGVSDSYRSANQMFDSDANLKGCVEAARLGEYLLPFFDSSLLENDTSVEKFTAEELVNLQIGCHGDPVCEDGWHECWDNTTEQCVDIWDDYQCDCLPGFNGTYCEHNIDECVNHECQNAATCIDGINDYTCVCIPGFTGFRCEVNIDECASQPCLNNGTCHDEVASYTCNCTELFTGPECQLVVGETCEENPDLCNNGTCTADNTTYDGYVTFNCSCLPGYNGSKCDEEIDYCASNPCDNNATCNSYTNQESYDCTCLPGYTGYNCETDIDECASDPCQNNANCTDHVNHYNCTCEPGWIGDHCEEDVNECEEFDPCENGGNCTNTEGSYICDCTGTGFEGKDCEEDINECASENPPCQNGAECNNSLGGYDCHCTDGYEGEHCETADCDQVDCQNNGTCHVLDDTAGDDAGTWKCQCQEYYLGDTCERAGPCVSTPCDQGDCEQEDDDYTCICNSGWTGVNCTEDINECDIKVSCVEGNCTNLNGSYQCDCNAGFTGDKCDVNINECESNPCVNGACVDGVDGYECNCTGTGYEGSHCEQDINECLLDTELCQSGECINTNGSYHCDCDEDYVGRHCEWDDPCSDQQVCSGHGNCTTDYFEVGTEPEALCSCEPDYEGFNCEKYDPIVEPLEDDNSNMLMLIIGLPVALVIVLIVIVIIVVVMMARNKRATRGTYSPSRQEMYGSRVEMGNVLKQPPEERLI